jgi:hypothetical protein
MNIVGKAWATISENRKCVVITFEIFWILIFLLERLGSAGTPEVPQFIYVNF